MVYQAGPSIFTKRTLLLWALWAESQARQGDQRIEASPHIRIVTADRLCPRLSWWAAAAAAAGGGGGGGCPLALRCLFGGSSDQSSHIASLAEACSVIQPSKQPSETMNLVVSGLTVAFLSCVVEKLVDFDGVDLLLRRWSSIRCFKPRRISKSWFPTSFSE